MVLIYAKGRPEELKIGFSVSKKLGNAVTRNRIKRRLREAITPLIPDLKRGSKLIIIAKAPILDEKLPSIASGMRYLARKANLLCAPTPDGTPGGNTEGGFTRAEAKAKPDAEKEQSGADAPPGNETQ